jgi:hypothetical protein
MMPAFFWCDDDVFAIAPSVGELLEIGAPADLDEHAIATFLRLGYHVGNDTPFRSIKALPPRPVLDLAARRPAVSSSRPLVRRNGLSRRTVIEAYITLFRNAIAARATGDAIVPLSGGRDSRHILLELAEGHHPIRECVTFRHFAPRVDSDAIVAANLARAVGVRHQVLPEPGSRIPAEIRKNELTHYCTDEHVQFMAMVDYLGGHGAQVFDGIGGDVLSAGHFLNPESMAAMEAGVPGMTAYLLDQYDRTIERGLRRVLSRDAQARFSRDKAEARIQEELRHHVSDPDPVSAFYFWHRTRREVALASCALLPAGTRVEMPYLDDELYALLAGLDASVTMDHCLHNDAIALAHPRYSGFGYEQRAATKAAPWQFRATAVSFGTRLLRLPWQALMNPTYALASIAREFTAARGQHLWYMARLLPILQAERARRIHSA